MTCTDTPDEFPEVPLRIDRGHAEPEEVAALTVVLGAHIVGLRVREEDRRRREADQQHIVRETPIACWSGCWCCA
ncbi:acyl-CoA carboxylase subunit epsilon [Streptomyces chattanoogensis]|uniref:Uncharacterized protein n=1 Tax=Streptomyces chattanoogensis TaxID=66876 RepID=A0A0N1JWP1_9ACTN|nr:acyl-CoA carboxylase subunit epsilon [Streptomyces chattanoogensis]AJT62159.3 hypothetical protein T261_0469 [Streptomyces lydicus]KPC60338.1 hypothetical protein ADL29_30700 [Streptomyces chattanoogensis]